MGKEVRRASAVELGALIGRSHFLALPALRSCYPPELRRIDPESLQGQLPRDYFLSRNQLTMEFERGAAKQASTMAAFGGVPRDRQDSRSRAANCLREY